MPPLGRVLQPRHDFVHGVGGFVFAEVVMGNDADNCVTNAHGASYQQSTLLWPLLYCSYRLSNQHEGDYPRTHDARTNQAG